MRQFIDIMHDEEVAGHFPHDLLLEVDCALDGYQMEATHRVWAALNYLHERVAEIYEESNQNGSCIESMRDAQRACNDYLRVVSETFGLEEDDNGSTEDESGGTGTPS
jgi:hypothetical protein